MSKEIVIVSGLPRSGTSLMMQMLAAGGLEPLTDQIREADTDNPKGYFEFERVKKVKDDTSWLPDARGKVVKMISQLLYDLPDSEIYKVVFMRREMAEIIASQEKMLVRRGNPVPPHAQMAQAFETHLDSLFKWLAKRPNFSRLELRYNTLFENPVDCVQSLCEFLGRELYQDEMLGVIDPGLYRNRKESLRV